MSPAGGQELEAGDAGGLVHGARDHGRPALDLDVAGHGQLQPAGGRLRQAEMSTCWAEVVSSGPTMSRASRCRPDALDQQVSRPSGPRPIGRVAVVELGGQQPHAAQVQRHGVQAVFQHVDHERAGEAGLLASVVTS